jgi:hypothetical protein
LSLLRLQRGLQPVLLLLVVVGWRAVYCRHLYLDVLLLLLLLLVLLFGVCLSSSSGSSCSRSGCCGSPLLCCLQASRDSLNLPLLLQLQQCIIDLLGLAAQPVPDSVPKQPAAHTHRSSGSSSSGQTGHGHTQRMLQAKSAAGALQQAYGAQPQNINCCPCCMCLRARPSMLSEGSQLHPGTNSHL